MKPKSASPPSARSGEIVAVLLSIWFGMLAVTVCHLWTVADPYIGNMTMLKLGTWITGWWGIGPYAGKETVGLLVWLTSWLLLHVTLRRKELELRNWFYASIAGFAVVMLLIWPPIYHSIFGWLPPIP